MRDARYAYLGGDYKPYSMTRYNEITGYASITFFVGSSVAIVAILRGEATSYSLSTSPFIC